MKQLTFTVVSFILFLTLAAANPRKSRKQQEKEATNNGNKKQHAVKQEKDKQEITKVPRYVTTKKRNRHKVYKKFNMIAVPTFALENSATRQGAVQQMLLPASTSQFAQNTLATNPELMSDFSTQNTLGKQFITQQSSSEQEATEVPQTLRPQIVQYQTSTGLSNEGTTIQDNGATQSSPLYVNTANELDAGSQDIQMFSQSSGDNGVKDDTKSLNNGLLPESTQSKQQAEGISSQEVKIVNLGDEEKTGSFQKDNACGGCPSGANCINGQCQIEEQASHVEGLTTGKVQGNKPTTIDDIRNLETQEIASLIKEADAPSTSVPYSPYTSPDQTSSKAQVNTNKATLRQEKPVKQPQYTGGDFKELREFARMYKMYQFIRKMEERVNDPDCAPVCRKICKKFCPVKCCHGPKVNNSVVSSLMHIAHKIQSTEADSRSTKELTGKNANTEDSDRDKTDKESKEKKHILTRIVKNNKLIKPRR